MESPKKVIHDFGKLQEEISKRISTHYPSLKFPQSLLFYKREVIASALEEAIKAKADNKKIVDLLETSRMFLDCFVDDQEAYRSNDELLGQDGYWEAIRRKGII